MDNRTFLGTGVRFPPQIDPGTGRMAVSSGAQSVKESVYIILMTAAGERWLEPEFGSQLMKFAFMDVSVTTINILSSELRNTILEQEPRISEVQIEVDADSKEDCLIINLSYTLAGSNTTDNLVFPFYLNTIQEEYSDAES